MRRVLNGSKVVEKTRQARVRNSASTSIIPHMLGMMLRFFDTIMKELHTVCDNPVFLEDSTALIGGNSHSYSNMLSVIFSNAHIPE